MTTRTSDMDTLTVCRLEELPEGEMRLVEVDGRKIGVFRCGNGDLYAIEDRCSHDDGPLCEGEWDEETCMVVCPRHGSAFELATGRPRSLPAFLPVATYSVRVVDGVVKVDVPG